MPNLILDHSQLLELSAEILSQGSSFRFQAGGGSMTPFIRHGDIILVKPVQISTLRVGDVIFFQATKEKLIAHRIIRIEIMDGHPQFIARGDALPGPGEVIQVEQVFGQVVRIDRGAKVIHLDTYKWRSLGILWGKLVPITLQIRKIMDWVAIGLIAKLSSLGIYRQLARYWFDNRTFIRHAGLKDASNLSQLYGYNKNPALENPDLTFTEQIQAAEDDEFILVADIGNRLAGSLTVKRSSHEDTIYPGWWIFGMLVRLRYRGAGIGEKLLNQAIMECAEKCVSRLNLLVEEGNKAAIRLYKKLGFQPLSIHELDAELESEVQRGKPRRVILSRSIETSPILRKNDSDNG